MGALQRFEKRLEGMVEGTFAKVFKGVVHPVEILNAMQREAEAQKSPQPGGRVLVPNRYIVELSDGDHDRLAGYITAMSRDLAQSHGEFIGEQGWAVYGDIVVDIVRGEDLATGSFRVRAQVHTGSDVGVGVGSGMRLVADDGRYYPLGVGATVIGRGDQATIRLADVGASRQHARLDYDGSQIVLTDLGSANGTLVNGRRVPTAVPLNPGDEVVIGGTRLTFRTDGVAEATQLHRPSMPPEGRPAAPPPEGRPAAGRATPPTADGRPAPPRAAGRAAPPPPPAAR
jgi:hypothetical protein